MHHFALKDGVLHAEGVNIDRSGAEVETPFYCYSTATLTRHYDVFKRSFGDLPVLVCYAVKANSNQAVLKTLGQLGAGMDVVSEGELRRARAAGVPAAKITFSGVGKTAAEIAPRSTKTSCASTSSRSRSLRRSRKSPHARGRTARIALRVNPDVDARTHAKISTGKAENKFGIPLGARARGLCARRGAAGHRSHRHRYSYRLADHRPRTVRQCFRFGGGVFRRAGAPTAIRSSISISAAASAFLTGRQTRATPFIPISMPRSCAVTSAASARN